VTRRDYVLIAEALKHAREEDALNAEMQRGVDIAIFAIGEALALQNGRFDLSLFFRNSGVPECDI